MIEEGSWKARACEGTLAYTNGGNDQIAIDFALLEGPDIGAHITWYGYFTDDTFERTIESLRLMGWGGTDLSDLEGIDSNEVRLVIAHEPDLQGELRARVKWVNGLGGIAVKSRMDAGASAAFAQRMKGRILALGANQGQRVARPQPSAPRPAAPSAGASHVVPDQSTDDIPF